MAYCLPKEDADRFKRGIISGEIDPAKMADMTSEKRHAFLADILGESNAGPVNTLFESKLLLKNQQAGMIAWAKQVMGHNRPAQKTIIDKIQGMKDVLTPKTEDAFLSDLAEHKLGTKVTLEEAQRIADLAEEVQKAKADKDAGGDRLSYGRAVVELHDFVNELKLEARKIRISDFKKNPGATIGRVAHAAAGNTKAIRASMDDSAIFRQGWKTLLTHPGIWQANARQSFVNLVKAYGSEAVMKELNADIVSRPNYDLMKLARLKVYNVNEEAFPTSLPEKLSHVGPSIKMLAPVRALGNLYRSTEHAYTAFVQKTRADVFDKYIEIARKAGLDLNDEEELHGIGKLTNSLTGRAHLGKIEPVAGIINNVFFSPRLVKSHLDTLLLHPFESMGGDRYWSFARKQAAINLLKIIGGTAAILTIAKAIKKDSVDMDPRSADFGQIKVGHTRFDMTGGMRSIVTLAARLLTMASKSSTTGKVHPLNTGRYGSETGMDVLGNFAGGKLAPVPGAVRDVMKGQTFDGKTPTWANEVVNLLVPMTVTNFQELHNDPKSANIILAVIADALGISTNTYGPYQKRQPAHK